MIRLAVILVLLPVVALAYPDTWSPTWTNGDLIHWFIPGNEAQSSGVERCLAGDVATNAGGYNWNGMFSQGSKLDRTKADYKNCIPAYVWKHLIPDVNTLTYTGILATVGAKSDYFDPGLRVGNLAILSNGWKFIPPIATNISIRYWTNISWTNSVIYTANTNLLLDWWYTNSVYPLEITGGAISRLDGVNMDGRYVWNSDAGPPGWYHETSGWYQLVYEVGGGVYELVDRWPVFTIDYAFWRSTNGISGPYYPYPYSGITNATGTAYARFVPQPQGVYVNFTDYFATTNPAMWPTPEYYKTNSPYQLAWWISAALFPKFPDPFGPFPEYWGSVVSNAPGAAPSVGVSISGQGAFSETFEAITEEWPVTNGATWAIEGVWTQTPVSIAVGCTGVASQIAANNIWTGTPHRAWVYSATNSEALTLLAIYPTNWTYDSTIVIPNYLFPDIRRTDSKSTVENHDPYTMTTNYAPVFEQPWFPYDTSPPSDDTTNSWTDLTYGWTSNLVETWEYQYTTNWIDGGTNKTLYVYALAPTWTDVLPRQYHYSVFSWTYAYTTNGVDQPVKPPTVPYTEPSFITTNVTTYTNFAAVTNWTTWVQTNLVVEGAGLANANGTYTNVSGTYQRGAWSVFPTGGVYRLGSNTTHYYVTTGDAPDGVWTLIEPVVSNLIVSGAGYAAVNGTYVWDGGSWVYDVFTIQPRGAPDGWMMFDADINMLYTNATPGDVATTWYISDYGTNPPPTITMTNADTRVPAPTAYLTNLYFAAGTNYSATNNVLLQDSGDTVLDETGLQSYTGTINDHSGTAWMYSGTNDAYWSGEGPTWGPRPYVDYWSIVPFVNCYVPVTELPQTNAPIRATATEAHSESLNWSENWTDTSAIRVFMEFDFWYK